MESNNKQELSSGSKILQLLKAAGNAVLMVIVAPFMFLNESRRALSEKVYNGLAGAFRMVIGVLLAFAASAYTGHYLGWTHGFGPEVWLSSGIVAWFASYCFAWPLVYLLSIRPAIKLAELVWQAFHRVTKKYADAVFGGTVRAVASVLPGSQSAWKKVEERKDNWVTRLALALSYPVSLAAGAYAGWFSFEALSSLAGGGLAVSALAMGAGTFVALVLVAALWQCIEEGKLPFVALALGVGLERLFSPDLASMANLAHLPVFLQVAIHALAVVAFVWYLFPLAHLALSGGLIKWLVEKLKPLNESVYDDRDRDYSVFFHNLTTIAASIIATSLAYSFTLAIGLPIYVSVIALAIVASAAYLWVYDVVDHGGGTFITGLASSVYAGYYLSSSYFAWGHGGGLWIALPLGILFALVWLVLLFPLAYLLLKPVFVLTRISKLGPALARLHEHVERGFQSLSRQLMKVYDASYGERSSYQVWFLHASNLALAALLVLNWESIAGILPEFARGETAAVIGKILIAGLSYILVGKFLQKSGIGIAFVGAMAALAFGIWLSSATLATGAVWPALAIVGVLGWLAAFCLLFPAGYLGLRFVANPLVASWTASALSKLHDFAWSSFSFVWEGFLAAYRLLSRLLFKPIAAAIGGAAARIARVYKQLRDKIIKSS